MAAEPMPTEQERFFDAVFGSETGYLFISTKDRTKDSDWHDHSFVYPLQLRETLAFVQKQDDAGNDVYVAAQLYKEPNRRLSKNVKTCPSAWADLDTACPWGINPEPTVVLETSPGRWHGFWRAPMPMDPARAEEISRQIAYAHHREGADLGGWDLTQVLRIPGTRNHKYEGNPVVLLKRCDTKPIPWSAFATLPPAPKKRDSATPTTDDDGTPPIPLKGFDLENWQKTEVQDRSAWAMSMVSTLKDNGLSDRLVEVALANHPIYLAKAREKWGNKESLIYDDIRRCVQRWRDHPNPILDMSRLRPRASEAPQRAQAAPTGEIRYPIQTLAQLAAMQHEEIKDIVSGILWGRRIHWFFSDPNTGKTLFLLAVLMHVAAGKPFMGRPVVQMPVMMIEEDSPFSVIAEYVDMLADIYDFDLETLPFYANKVQGLRIVSAEARESVIEAINSCPERPGIVLLDACERLVPSDRFNTKELDELTLLLQWMLNEKITPVMIDHTNRAKAEKGKEKDFKSNPMERLFGARAKSAISDVMVYFDGFLKMGSVEVVFAKFRGQLPSGYAMTFDPSAGFDITDKPPPPASGNEQRVMRFLNSAERKWYAVSEITSFVNGELRGKEKPVNDRTIRRAVISLAARRWLLAEGETRERRYRLNPDTPGLFQ